MEKSRYIAIEGPIGVGKSSLVDLLARELGGRTLMEAVDDNPFLPRFYGDIKKYAFQTQLFFLLSRYQQQKEMFQQELFNTSVVSDYLFAKDRIFAYLNLDENELCLYEQVYRLLDTRIPKPDLVIYLQASTEVLLERIAGRNIDYEKHVREEYLERLVVNTTEIDFVNNPDDLSSLVKEIRSMKGGSQHYIPIASS